MATSIANLAVMLSANTSQYSSGLRRAQGQTRNFGRSVNQSISRVFSSVARLGSLVAGGSAIVVLTSQLRRLDDAAKTASKIGTTTEELSRLQFAAKQTGVETNTLNMAMQRMVRRISEAARGTGEAKDAIKELGLDAAKLRDMGPAKAMREIADAMVKIESPADRVRLAMKLFDSEGVALVNTLAGGSAALDAFGATSDRIGNTIDSGAAKSAEEFNDSIQRLKSSFGGIAASAVGVLAPAIQRVSDKSTKLVAAMRSYNSESVKNIARNTAMAAGFTAGMLVMSRMIKIIARLVAALRSMAVAQSIVTAMSGPKGWAIVAAGLAVAAGSAFAVNKLFDKMGTKVEEVAEKTTDAGIDTESAMRKIEMSVEDVGKSIDESTKGPLEDAYQMTLQWKSGFEQAEAAAKQIFESTRTPAERLASQVKEINELFKDNLIDAETASRALGQLNKDQRRSGNTGPPKLNTNRVNFGALGARGASTGREELSRIEKQQLEEAKKRAAIQQETLDVIKTLDISQAARVVRF